ncbi:hypothetical protein Bca4012_072050 [Brassica carinata]|uniref:(rape) hypothetical protein n=1 Tax=Brassica napus TaxID=3708 RepID=A0A816L729_BRANA|nr:unnamed protein product [Brassica napus]CAF1928801.1 unnamed protein product [Brassica napus]
MSAVREPHSSVENKYMETRTKSEWVNGLGAKEPSIGVKKRTEELTSRKWLNDDQEKMQLKLGREVQRENMSTVNKNVGKHFAEAREAHEKGFQGSDEMAVGKMCDGLMLHFIIIFFMARNTIRI